MTLWRDEEKLRKFAFSGAHLETMKESARIAREIRTITIDADTMPSWKEAERILKAGKVLRDN